MNAAPSSQPERDDPTPELLTSDPVFEAGGRSWHVELNVLVVDRVRKRTGHDLWSFGDRPADMLALFYQEPLDLFEIIGAVVSDELDDAGVDGPAFGRLFKGDVIDRARDALIAGLVQLFPNERDRLALARVVEKTRGAIERARGMQAKAIADGTLDRALNEAIEAALPRGEHVGDARPSASPASSA